MRLRRSLVNFDDQGSRGKGEIEMRKSCLFLLIGSLAVLLMTGCASAPERALSRQPAQYASLPNGHDPLNPDQPLPTYEKFGAEIFRAGAIAFLEARRGHALNVLALSGGGQNGAFGAGFLKGWREQGDRPEFDVVTGVSTGALLATHAFLGTPADDAVLEEIFTHVDEDSIYEKKPLIGTLFGGNSLYDTTPLQRLLDQYITEATLRRVANAHDDYRRLLVGTTNLDYDQTWVWNLGLIAKDGKLDLYKRVLLASASPPVAFPPVEIAGHLFADGGTRQNLVVFGLTGGEPPPPPRYGPGTVFVVQNGKETTPPRAVQNDIFGVAGDSIGIMLTSSMETLMMRSYVAARAHGYEFRTVAIPEEVDVGHNALAFDPREMRAAFDAGYALANQADPWERVPAFIEDLPPWALEVIQPPSASVGGGPGSDDQP
jgi:predicted acylesterase/phospholipase RssA